MPSAEKVSSTATKLESAPPSEPKSVENPQRENADQNEKSVPAIQQVISIISNKVRNLEKRKNKLDGYKLEEESGKELSSEQQKAVEKYDEVIQQLSLSKEFCKQFQLIANTASKEAKRDARKNLFTRQIQETTKIREVLMLQELLQRLKEDGVRSDFVNQRGGACPLDKAEWEFMDKFAQHVVPLRPKFSNEQSFSSSAKTAADHLNFVIDGRPRQFLDTGFTYEKAKELFTRIQSCCYWNKDVVEVVSESRAETETPNTEDLESKYEKSEEAGEEPISVAAPAPAQVPTPTFNGNVNVMPVQQQAQQPMHQRPLARVPQQSQQAPLPATPTNGSGNMKTTVTAVENAYFNQMKYSQPQGPLINNSVPITPSQNDFGTNFSFLQDSELEPVLGSQQKMPVNVIQTINNQPTLSPVQIQQMQQVQQASQNFKAANFLPQSPIAGQMYPPGLKVQHMQNTVSHIPVNYQPNPQQLNQQPAVPSPQVTNMIPKQQQPVNGNQAPGFGAARQTPPVQQQQAAQQTSRPAYPTMVPKAQYQQNNNSQQNAKPSEQKQSAQPQKQQQHDGSGDALKSNERVGRNSQGQEKEKQRDDQYQQQPQIDTWTNETAAQSSGNNNYSSRSSGGYNRSNRTSGGGAGGGAKYNNYRNPQQPRNYNENGNGDSSREGQAAGTFFRNNERYNGSTTPANRFEGRGGGSAGGNFKPREGNHRAGSGRFAGSASASAQGSSNSGQRK